MTKNEMTLKIIRNESTKDYTSGIFSLQKLGVTIHRGATLELGEGKCIPKGEYNIKWRYSPKNKTFTPILYNENVSMERFIEIHVGNTTKDTLGCILVGEYAETPNHLVNSREAFSHLQFLSKFSEFKVVIS